MTRMIAVIVGLGMLVTKIGCNGDPDFRLEISIEEKEECGDYLLRAKVVGAEAGYCPPKAACYAAKESFFLENKDLSIVIDDSEPYALRDAQYGLQLSYGADLAGEKKSFNVSLKRGFIEEWRGEAIVEPLKGRGEKEAYLRGASSTTFGAQCGGTTLRRSDSGPPLLVTLQDQGGCIRDIIPPDGHAGGAVYVLRSVKDEIKIAGGKEGCQVRATAQAADVCWNDAKLYWGKKASKDDRIEGERQFRIGSNERVSLTMTDAGGCRYEIVREGDERAETVDVGNITKKPMSFRGYKCTKPEKAAELEKVFQYRLRLIDTQVAGVPDEISTTFSFLATTECGGPPPDLFRCKVANVYRDGDTVKGIVSCTHSKSIPGAQCRAGGRTASASSGTCKVRDVKLGDACSARDKSGGRMSVSYTAQGARSRKATAKFTYPEGIRKWAAKECTPKASCTCKGTCAESWLSGELTCTVRGLPSGATVGCKLGKEAFRCSGKGTKKTCKLKGSELAKVSAGKTAKVKVNCKAEVDGNEWNLTATAKCSCGGPRPHGGSGGSTCGDGKCENEEGSCPTDCHGDCSGTPNIKCSAETTAFSGGKFSGKVTCNVGNVPSGREVTMEGKACSWSGGEYLCKKDRMSLGDVSIMAGGATRDVRLSVCRKKHSATAGVKVGSKGRKSSYKVRIGKRSTQLLPKNGKIVFEADPAVSWAQVTVTNLPGASCSGLPTKPLQLGTKHNGHELTGLGDGCALRIVSEAK